MGEYGREKCSVHLWRLSDVDFAMSLLISIKEWLLILSTFVAWGDLFYYDKKEDLELYN